MRDLSRTLEKTKFQTTPRELSSVEFSRAELPLIRWSGIGTKPMRTNFHRVADVI